jgi:uncharacterized protein
MNYLMKSLLETIKMKNISFLFLLLPILVFSQEIPERPNPLLTPQEEANLERKLVGYYDSTSTQIAVVTVKTIGDYAISEYATDLGRKWGVGGKENNNGVVILVSMEPRKTFIAMGYGMEGVLPDAYVKRVTSDVLNPNLSSGNYYQAFDQASESLFKYATGEYKNTNPKKKRGKGISGGAIFLLVILFIFIISKFRSVRNGHMSSGPLDILTTMLLLGNMGGRRGGGDWDSFSGGGGGGGFDGFGGGDFGGGGAGGDW